MWSLGFLVDPLRLAIFLTVMFPALIALAVPAGLDGKRYHVALGERVLPQGACTSPAITNAICRRLDARLAGLGRALGFAYTRYADDLTFSGDDADKIVNRGVGFPREEKRALRALLHNCARLGITSQNRNGHPDFAAHLRGRVAWATMVELSLDEKLWPMLERALGRSPGATE